jgi:hypothetical protein
LIIVIAAEIALVILVVSQAKTLALALFATKGRMLVIVYLIADDRSAQALRSSIKGLAYTASVVDIFFSIKRKIS